METQKEKKATASNTTKCGSWIKRFICSRVARHLFRKTLSKTLPNMAKNASTPQLATSINNHLKETNEQISIGKNI
jgi:ferritin-like metal-binding protein YciE